MEYTNNLKERQHKVFILFAAGYSKPRIGEVIDMSEHTADKDIQAVYNDLGTNCRQHAINLAWIRGYLVKEYFEADGKPNEMFRKQWANGKPMEGK